ncbi:MAG TPA: 4-hydroxyphenylacetate 3-hydroxylase N-terminal domain-containing protein [Acidimicrobiales bacterium]|jgi:4-hydroxyphenylacetate 3-monooxygenase|nr:4-hydroxyphenylacetate 3-hydroxylase N-terminal domain-containing protein [Acidimicrobiales bacterium]
MRSGRDYLESIADARTVIVDGERVERVAQHPAFAGVAASVARLYDEAHDRANGMVATFGNGTVGNAAFLIPRSREDLARRREAIARWARLSHGFLGRSPDHVASFFAGFASAPGVFDRKHSFGENVRRWYERIVEEDLYAAYVIIPPQVDRSTTAQGWDEQFLQVGIAKERDDGVVLRGSQMLGTGAAVANVLFVSCIKPLAPGDEPYAISVVVPLSTPGLRVYCRRPYALGIPSAFDYPLSARFDEPDALVVFDDVFVPFENAFVLGDVEGVRSQFFDTPAHVLGNSQAQIRFAEKLKFIVGIARRIAAVNGIDRLPPVQGVLGELAALAAVVEGMVVAAEASAEANENGVFCPNPRFVYGAMGLQAEIYPRVLGLLRDLAGGGVLQLPSSARQLLREPDASDFERYVRSPGVSSVERVKLFKLAWDVIGSEFAGRHQQYEMFYAGAPFVVKGYAYRNYGYEEPLALVSDFLASYGLDEEGLGASR